jgi:uncharacterized protein DUF4157
VRVTRAPEASPEAAFRDAASGGGAALPYREDMERAFGHDLGGVQAHRGRDAALQDTGMRAATRDERVVFADPSSTRELVAHVVQQRGGTAATAAPVSGVDSDAEREAEAVAGRAAMGERVSITAAASESSGAIQNTSPRWICMTSKLRRSIVHHRHLPLKCGSRVEPASWRARPDAGCASGRTLGRRRRRPVPAERVGGRTGYEASSNQNSACGGSRAGAKVAGCTGAVAPARCGRRATAA